MSEMTHTAELERAVTGCLLGTAVGDAVGLACEGLSKHRQARIFPCLDGPRLIGRRGMVSDDTEQTCLVAQALIESVGEPELFQRSLARGMRIWLLGLPAGVGWATLRATVKLCVGVSPAASGVFSAGNGPAMRSALLGVCFGDQPERLRALVQVSTRITHTDPRAEAGALAVAVAAWVASQSPPPETLSDRYLWELGRIVGTEAPELLELARRAAASAAGGETTHQFAASLGAGERVSGYIYQTVPVALHAWLRNPTDYRTGILEIIRCGGDTDTTATILGAILGAGVGVEGIPSEWKAALLEWPRTNAWMTRLAAQVAEVCARRQPQAPLSLPFLAVFGRNLFFAAVILAHGFRRLLPPY